VPIHNAYSALLPALFSKLHECRSILSRCILKTLHDLHPFRGQFAPKLVEQSVEHSDLALVERDSGEFVPELHLKQNGDDFNKTIDIAGLREQANRSLYSAAGS